MLVKSQVRKRYLAGAGITILQQWDSSCWQTSMCWQKSKKFQSESFNLIICLTQKKPKGKKAMVFTQAKMIFSFKEDAMFLIQPSEKVVMWNYFTFFSAHSKHIRAFWNMGLVNMPECQDFGCNSETRKDSSCSFLCSSWFMSQKPGIWYTYEKIQYFLLYLLGFFVNRQLSNSHP